MHYAGRLAGALLLGLVALVAAFVTFTFLLPFLLPLGLGLVVLIAILAGLWGLAYLAMFIGAAIYYLFKPMEVRKGGSYSIDKAKEAGRREKGKTT